MTRKPVSRAAVPKRGFDGQLEELEARILFNADLQAMVPDPGLALPIDGSAAHVAVLPASPTSSSQETTDTSSKGSADASVARLEIVFIDASVPDADQMLAQLHSQDDAGRTLEIHWLNDQSDGVSQITDILKGREGIDALHIISHGDAGGLQLGNGRLDSSALTEYLGDLASWGGALSADADLMLYGCDLASSSAGRALVDNLALLTGADVAASLDATGSTLLGGNWTLEYQDGHIETSVAVEATGQAAWQHLLSVTATSASETLVNGTTSGTQENSIDSGKQVAADANGNYVVVWEDATTLDVYARLYNADGTPKAAQFQVNTDTTGVKDEPTVAMDANGNFVVAWRSSTQDADGYGVYAQRYNASGVAQGSEFHVNTYTTNAQGFPAIAMSTIGFVITWTSLGQDGDNYGVYAQRYNVSGVAQGAEFRVSTTTANIQKDSRIGMDSSGNFVIAWQSYAQDGSGYGVYAQRYNASGVAQGTEFRVNVTTTGEQILSDVSMNASGSFVIAWHDSSGVDGSGYGVFARTYNSSGVAQTSEFVLSNFTYSTQWNASVVMGSDGSFVAAWDSLTADGYSYGISMRQFSLAGVEIAPETIVNTTRSGDQRMPSVAWGGNQVIVTWSGNGSGDNLGIFSRRYTTALPAVVTSVGTETRANTTTSNTQQTNSDAGKQVATAANGNYVVVWEDTTTDYVYGRLYDANGTALTAEFRVNTDTTAARDKNQPTVAMDDNGNFVIAWHSQLQDGSGYGIYAQRYNASGVAQGSEFRVNTYTSSDQEYPAIAMSAVGFVITWTSYGQDGSVEGIYAQRYNASGVAQGSEFRVNTTTSSIQRGSRVGMDDNGNFVIAWSSSGQDGGGYGAYAQRYNASGVAQGSEFRVNVTTAGEQFVTDVSMNGSGSFVISWDASASDGAGYGTFARTYSSSGTALSGEIQINSFELDEQRNSSVSMSDNGDFVAVFQSGLQDGAVNAIALRVFSQTGTEIGGERLVNTTQSGSQSDPSVSWNGGYIAVVWSGNGTGDNLGVFSQRYISNVAPVITSNGGGSSASVNVAENSTAVTTVVATDAVDQTLVYSISGGADAALFSINSSTGVLSFIGAPNFEAPGDSGANNVYDVVVMVSDGSLTDTQSLAITVTDLNDNSPVITSNGGGNSASINVAENSTAVATVVATDADAGSTFTYSISGGSDSAKFSINASTGVLTFLVAPNLESPTDSGGNNVYDVIVRVSDGLNTDTQALAITVTDVDEFDVGSISDTNASANSVVENASNGTVVGITASATDADGTTNAITYSLSNNAGGRFTINASTGVVTVANGSLLNYESATSHSITVLATSADGSSSSQAMTINLADADEFDVGAVTDTNAAANSVAENATNGTVVGITASATDADGTTNTITYSLSDSAGGRFAINASTGVVTVANGTLLNYEAATSHAITVVATSADGSSSNQVMTINLSDVDEFDVGAVTDTNAAANSVAENATNGTVVGITASATDADGTTNTITYSLSDSASGRFAINASTGVVTVANGTLLNYEAATSHAITVVATSADGSSSNQVMTINLSDVDEFDVGAVTDTNAAANSVAENATNGTVVGITASATDADGTTNTITYSLSNNAGGRFAINASTGVVTVANGTLLNYEAATSHGITVVATSADGSSSSQAMTINLGDVDEFDVGAVSDTNAAANSVAENATNGTVVGITASATDADGTTNTITYSLSDSAGGRFAINASTGVVTVANGTLLNYEAATSHAITVVATSADGSSSNQAMTINLSDVDEFDVGAVTDTNAAANSVAENATNGTVVGITASATDADGTTNTITYSLSDNAGGRFTINASTGVVTVANGSLLNYESATSHSITVLATSADGSSSSQAMTINLADADEFDVGAVTDTNAAANSVAENATNGTVVGITASAVDADGTTNTITYSLSNNAGGRFAINASTGVVTVANGTLLNYEAATSHAITVVATSADGSSSSQAMTINLSDVDEFDVGAVSDANAAANSVAENVDNGTVVGITASAVDADGTTNTITYSLSDSAGGRFAINASTGVVTVANGTLLNYEAATSHAITVVATSADGSSSNQVMTINLSDVDEFDVGAVTDTNAAANSVAENATNGTVVGITASATDADGTTNTITYSLSDNAGGRFTINASTGVVTVANGTLLNYEAATSHAITVVATSADGSSSNQVMTINLSDVDEFDVGAVTDTNAAANSVAENATNGTVVGITASATDADGTTNTITYSLSNNAGGRFAINASTGVVTVANGTLLNYEAATSHGITVVATSADGSSSSQAMTINLGDVDEFDVGAVSDTNAAANSVAENATNGTVVGITASATDADGTTNTITYSLSDSAGGRFAINASTGVVTVANGTLLNYEAATSHAITVVATSADGSSSNQVMTINLSDVDEFDVGAITDANAAANSVAENAANGTVVGITASATDADGTTNTITYSLSENASGRFAINAVTGVVTVANGTLLNYEAATSHAITVVATSADGSSSSQVMTINLSDVDEFDVGAVTDINAAANSVVENAANGTVVGITANAADADATSNTITYSLSDSAGGRFAINAVTGVVTVANGTLLNYEAATSHAITVVATSTDGSSSNQVMTINLTDTDEFDVGAVTDTNLAANSVVENATNGTVVGITANATDADGTTNTITYSLSDNAGGRFAINAVTGVVTVANGTLLNYEAATSHGITVVATSTDGSSSNQVMTINLTDADEFDVGAVTDTNAAANIVAENATNGTVVGITAHAADADGTTNTITYSLSDSAGGRFAINASTGVVTVANGGLLNYEAANSHAITVVATSLDGSSSNQVMTINLTDVNEFAVGAVTDANAAANSVVENAANGTVVGITANATDADGTNNTVSYSLSDDAGGRFAINAITGVVTVADGSLLDFESAASHAITVVATSTDGSSSNQVMTVNLVDVNDFAVGSVSDANAAANSVAENAANGTVVGITANAVDGDGDVVTYSLSDDAGGRFTIDVNTGVVTVGNGGLLDYEAATLHAITVVATSTDGSSNSQVMTINLSDANEFPVGVVTDTNAAANSVAENAANGTVVGVTANATDADGTNNTVSYSLSDDAGGRFAIDAATGVVTVANGSLLDFESAASHAITVVATSTDGSSSNQVMTINLSDVNDFSVGVVTDVNAAANSVAENAANGTVVGITANAVDGDGDVVTYSLSDDAGGRFAINAVTGVVTVANGTLLNFEAATSHAITVLATSTDGSSSSQAMTINLSDVNEFPVGAVSDGNAAANSVAENAANGTVVGITASAVDADGTTNAVTYSLSDDAGGRFAIDAVTGVVTVANGMLMNYEAANSHAITVVATSADGSSSNQVMTISLSDVDEFDVGAITDANATANSVAENAANGTVVGITANATDADGTNNTITYSLSDSAGGRFGINAVTGVVTVADGSLLNYEAATSHAITVLATSADGSSSSQVVTINLSDVDEFDVGAVADVNAGTNSVAENAANGTVVGITASAVDADGTNNTVSYSLSDDAGGRFAINAVTGVVTVANGSLLNYELATSHAITVVATSADGSSSNQVMTINLSDANEFAVGAVSDTNAAANSVAENATNGTVVGITANAIDADGTTSTVSYSLSDDAGGRFAINASTGVVTVANGSLLDYEAATSHAITVVATSADGSSSNLVITISLSDTNEFATGAVSDVDGAANQVAENAANGTAVGITASAVDADGTNNTVSYSLSDDAGGRFSINAITGVVTVADGSLLNYEAATSHAITVVATSADGSSSNQVMTINLTDADEFAVGAVSDTNAAANSVAENAANGTVVGITANATDADGTNNTITYSLSDSAGGRFGINAVTGVVTVADGSLLNYEAATSHAITVLATSADGSSSSQVVTINLSDVDEFDVGAVTDVNAGTNSVAENAANGTVVGITASAVDADGTNNTVSYSLSDDAGGRFAINTVTGVVTVADGSLLNYELATSHAITVVATSADGSSSNQVMTINLSDANEFAVGAVSDTNAVANSVAENASSGTVVGVTANAIDADGTTSTVSYSLSDDAGGRFAINASSGVVTVANGSLLDYEAATSHAITVVATSADGSSSNLVITISLSDTNEFATGAVSDVDGAANQVAENAANGTVVGITASAVDADGTNNTVSYSLSDDAGGRFSINAITGVVTVADGSLLNYEAATSHAITVVATSADGSSSNQVMTINLTDADEFAVGAVSDTNAAANSVAENAANGTVVGITANATDADGTNNTITYSLSDSAGGRFGINAVTGVVTVANGTLLNYEAATSHAITVVATSADGSSSNQVMTINLSDADEFDVGGISDVNGAANSVAENATNGTVVGITASATDADSTTNTVTYALSDDAGGRFTINASTGVVTVANGSLLNYEAAASHAITVMATSTDGSSSSQVMTINLGDVDEFDVGAVSDSNAAANSVAENAANGTVVGITANAVDTDATNNGITYSLSDDAGGRFTINASTGVVTVANGSLLNYEAATSHAITVVATSADGSSSNQVMTINLSDADEFDVGGISDVNGAANSVAENATNGTVVGITASATDADSTTNTVTYALSDDAGGRFTINASTGVVTVANGSLLNYEAAASHAITVMATSTDGSSSSQVMTINLGDVDEFDVGAVSDSNTAANSVAENAANGTVVGITANAVDTDATNNGITYSLSDDAGGRFTINASTGVVTVANGTLLDYESATSHAITVVATSADGSSSSQVMTINLSDANEFDVGGISDVNGVVNSVAENATNGAVVGITANAMDADGTTNTVTYALSDDAGGRFTINASTGVVTVANGTLLDYESATSHAITVVATSADGSSSSQVMTINLSDANEFDVGGISDVNGVVNSVAENATNGAVVGITANAMDADGTTNTVTYALSDDAGGRFTINASTGVVTVANGTLLDYESATSHAITVVATSADGSNSSQSFTISITPVNDNAPVITSGATPAVAENTTTVGIVTATDADAGSTLTYSIVGGVDAAHFTVNGSTGVLSFVAAPDRENPADANGDNVYDVVLRVSDGIQVGDQTMAVLVTNINDAPVKDSGDFQVTAQPGVTLAPSELLNGFSDQDGDALNLLLVDSTSHGTLTILPDGSLRYEAAGGFSGSDHFSYTVSDGQAQAAVRHVNITVQQRPTDDVVVVVPPPNNVNQPTRPDPAPESPMTETPASPDEPTLSMPDRTEPAPVPPVPQAGPLEVTPSAGKGAAAGAMPLNRSQGFSFSLEASDFELSLSPGQALFKVLESMKVGMVPSQGLNLSLSTMSVHGAAHAPTLRFVETSDDKLVKVQKTVIQTSGAVASVGAVWWAARMSGLLASLMISTPAWRSLDPLPVMGLDEDADAKDEFEEDEHAPPGERHMDEKAASLFGRKSTMAPSVEHIG